MSTKNNTTVIKPIKTTEATKTIKTEIVKEPVNYKGLCGSALIQFGEFASLRGNRNINWKGTYPTKVYVTPRDRPEVYDLKEMELNYEFPVQHTHGGIYRILGKKQHSGGKSHLVRFIKPVDVPSVIIDVVTVGSRAKTHVSKVKTTKVEPQFEMVNGRWKIKDGAKPTTAKVKVII